MDPQTSDELGFLKRENDRLKKTVHNHTGKIHDLTEVVNSMQRILEDLRRKGLRFEPRYLAVNGEEGEKDGVQ